MFINNWIEYDGREMHWGLKRLLLVNILLVERRYQLNLVGFYKTLIIGYESLRCSRVSQQSCFNMGVT